ncbi:MAG: hypothetical protein CMJ76_11905 [Planctomycetaceae bacterium]|nr:hypothetical protein [Planctomycetaceae bacterium]|tara:strand:+ start:388 stop:849 length:462 start_codon:yes stop_codon:yes gene_type:complete
MTPEQRLADLGIELPVAPAAVANYVPCIQTGNLVMTAGQLPLVSGEVVHQGKVGAEITAAEGAEAAQIAVINGLAQIKELLGDLSTIVQVVRLEGFVQSAPGFQQQSVVMNGASDFIAEVFGDSGRHTRTAIGVFELPLNAACQISLFVEVAG